MSADVDRFSAYVASAGAQDREQVAVHALGIRLGAGVLATRKDDGSSRFEVTRAVPAGQLEWTGAESGGR